MLSVRVTDVSDTVKRLRATPKQVRRAIRLTANQITRELTKELGGSIPREHGTSVMGYRRVRAKKRFAKANRRRTRAITWLGLNPIQAAYGGRLRMVSGGAMAGRHFFKDGFIVRFKSGHTTIVKRDERGKLVEQTIDLPKARTMAKQAFERKRPKIKQMIAQRLEKVVRRKR